MPSGNGQPRTYSIAGDTLNGAVSSDSLKKSIQDSADITKALDYINTSGDVLDIYWKEDLPTGPPDQIAAADALVAAHDGVPLPDAYVQKVHIDGPVTDDNKPVFSMWPTEGDSPTMFSPDWSDPTTWYHGATRVVDEVATDLGAQTSYQIPNWDADRFLVDAYHGKISGEDDLLDSGSNNYRAVVKVNDVEKTEQDPHFGTGGDYTVDYDTGIVTFLAALSGGDVVKVTYHYVDKSVGDGSASMWVLAPTAGKQLKVTKAEVQFSDDIILNDAVQFAVYGLVDVFAPQLMPGVPSGTKIQLRRQIFKTMRDFYNDANGTYPVMPALGGGGWRGLTKATNTFPWNYQTLSTLSSAAGMEIRISLLHDVPFGGEYSTATFYCLSMDE